MYRCPGCHGVTIPFLASLRLGPTTCPRCGAAVRPRRGLRNVLPVLCLAPALRLSSYDPAGLLSEALVLGLCTTAAFCVGACITEYEVVR